MRTQPPDNRRARPYADSGRISFRVQHAYKRGGKGEVVIPQKLRKHLGVGPKTKFLVCGEGDVIVLKRLALPDVSKEWEEVFAIAKKAGLDEKGVEREVKAHRKRK